MAVRKRKPQDGGTPEKVIPPLAWLFMIMGVLLYIWAYKVPWFGQYCLLLSKFSFLLSFISFGYWIFLHPEKLMFLNNKLSSSKLNLDIVKTEKMKNFLFQDKAVVADPYDPKYQLLPQVNETKNGLKIEVIGNLRSWLISDSFCADLESFLNHEGYDVSIQNAQYHPDGWVYYTLIKSIKSDRLRF